MNIKHIEALKLALEALEKYSGIDQRACDAEDAIREALAEQPAQQEVDWEKLYRLEVKKKEALAAKYERDTGKKLTRIVPMAEQPAQDDPCIKCKGLGYYDEGHECDDGSMAGGNYVECDKCKQPDFIKHEVENAYDWSEWVCPDPESYLMKCCDCGLVHEAQFRVAKYKPAPSDECEVVSDPDLQAQFRMRRSEQWSPADTAHRPGGLPMAEQPAQQQEPVAWLHTKIEGVAVPHRPADLDKHPDRWTALYPEPKPCPTCEALARTVMMDQTAHDKQRKPLTDDQIMEMYNEPRSDAEMLEFARAIEAAHGIGEQK